MFGEMPSLESGKFPSSTDDNLSVAASSGSPKSPSSLAENSEFCFCVKTFFLVT